MTSSTLPPETFKPNRLLRNTHVQSIIASAPPRKMLVKRRAKPMLANTEDHILDCGNGVRLLGHYSPADNDDKGLVTLIHGWEGSSESTGMMSVACSVYEQGYSVFRLNLRDHGHSHHLNRELFNSTRLEEVLGALEAIQASMAHATNYLVGFSLGGNFSLRAGAEQAGRNFRLDRIIAVCPVVYPPNTMVSLENGSRLYHDYFLRKWKRSLSKKAAHFPEYDFSPLLEEMNSLREMNRHFVPNYTSYTDTEAYLKAYAISGDRLKNLTTPTHLITSTDDPVVLAEDLALINQPPSLKLEITRYGGHCGFIEDFALNSWIDRRILHILKTGE